MIQKVGVEVVYIDIANADVADQESRLQECQGSVQLNQSRKSPYTRAEGTVRPTFESVEPNIEEVLSNTLKIFKTSNHLRSDGHQTDA